MQACITQQLEDMTHDNVKHLLLMHEGVSLKYCARRALKMKALKRHRCGSVRYSHASLKDADTF